MQALLGRLVVIAVCATAVLSGCVASDHDGHPRPAAHPERAGRTARDAAGPTTVESTSVASTTTAAPAPVASPARSARPTSRPSQASAASPVAPRTATSGWARYDGQLSGGTYYVARALGAGLHVSTQPDAAPATTLTNPLASGAPRVVVVVQDPGGDWLQVLLPIRPNASLGWVRRGDVEVSAVHYRVEIDRAAHRLRVFDRSEMVVADEPIAVGKASTPTPPGQFFTVELLQPANPHGDYGPYAFTLSGYSEVYQTFGSGDGAVGMHGTNEPGSIGRDASHGCIRLHNAAIQRLAGILPLGAPVFIR